MLGLCGLDYRPCEKRLIKSNSLMNVTIKALVVFVYYKQNAVNKL